MCSFPPTYSFSGKDMGTELISGNIFASECQTIVNTVNCVGVMGAGIALECRLRYPAMYKKYVELCNNGKIDVGLLWLYTAKDRKILNFPTKRHWRNPSKVEYLHSGLKNFAGTYAQRGIVSIAFPLLGASQGGIPQDESIGIMRSHLDQVEIPIEIYRHDPTAKDDLYDKAKDWLQSLDIQEIGRLSNLRPHYVLKVIAAMESPEVVQLNQLAGIKGIGIKTLEEIFSLAIKSTENSVPVQQSLI